MFFSIIVPVYNIDTYLRKCLNSIQKQTFKDYEVVIIDDGSTDNSSTISDEYALNDSRFIVKHKANGGVVSARKEGAVTVRGKYIVTVDGDDYIAENLLESLYKEIISCNPDYLAYGYKEVDEEGNINYERVNDIDAGLYTDEKLKRLREGFMYDNMRPGINGGNLIFSLWTKAIKRAIYVESQLKVDNQVEKGDDLIVNIYALNRADSVFVSEIKGYYYRQQPGSLTHVVNLEDIRKQAVLRDEIIKASKAANGIVTNQAKICIIYTAYERLQRLINRKTSYSEYKRILREIEKEDLFSIVRDAKCEYPSKNEILKIYIIKNKLWIILYVYLRIHSGLQTYYTRRTE